MKPYLIDADCLITAKTQYAMDICPGFWDWLDKQNELGVIFSVQKVANELTQGNDEVATWARRKGDKFFLPPDKELAPYMARIVEWVLDPNSNFTPASTAKFMNGADPILIAYALAHEFIVVTNEACIKVQPPPAPAAGVKIPNVCNHFGLKTKALVDLLRATGAKFDLRLMMAVPKEESDKKEVEQHTHKKTHK